MNRWGVTMDLSTQLRKGIVVGSNKDGIILIRKEDHLDSFRLLHYEITNRTGKRKFKYIYEGEKLHFQSITYFNMDHWDKKNHLYPELPDLILKSNSSFEAYEEIEHILNAILETKLDKITIESFIIRNRLRKEIKGKF